MRYYVNKNAQANGDHEVHITSCTFFPSQANAEYLGEFASCVPAVAEAARRYPKANGCYYCASACNTG